MVEDVLRHQFIEWHECLLVPAVTAEEASDMHASASDTSRQHLCCQYESDHYR